MSRALPRFRRTNPAMSPAPANTFQLSLIGNLEGQLVVNTFYYRDSGSPLDPAFANEANLITAFIAGPYASLRPCVSNDVTWTRWICRCVSTPTRAPYSQNIIVSQVGTGGAGHLPTTNAFCITRRTAIRGQCGRGRLYLPGLPPGFLVSTSSSLITLAAQATAQTFATSLIGNLVAGGYTFTGGLVSHGPRTQQPRVLGYADLTTATPQATVASCRRRRLGRGK